MSARSIRLLSGLALRMAAVFLLPVCLSPAAEVTPSEYQVKAVFLLNFTKFIDWPANAFASPDSPFSICILGDDPFGRELDRIVEGETVNGRRLAVQRFHRGAQSVCQVVFIGKGEKEGAKVVGSFGPGVLTVGEGTSFLREGGIIAFVLENRRVRFDVNLAMASRAGLQVNSKLLNVARIVER